MALLTENSGNPFRTLDPQDYKSDGQLKTLGAELALVVGSAAKSEAFIQDKQWSLLWRDADLLFQSPRPMTVFENTYILEPNVSRFTVAKVVNSIVPQLYKGLFYQDPPMIIRPRPGTSQEITDAKTFLFSSVLDSANFKEETKIGLEQMAHLGTGIWKWGIRYEEIITRKRVATVSKITAGPVGAQETALLPTDSLPSIQTSTRIAPRVYFESREVSKVLIDPHTPVGDIRKSSYVIDIRYMDFYEMKILRDAIKELPEGHPEKEGWDLPQTDSELMSWWMPPVEDTPVLSTDQATYSEGVVHHSEKLQVNTSPDLLFKKLEVLEYWDKRKQVHVVARKKVIKSGKNPYGVTPFLSANWWNRPKAFYGMGLGLIVGQNQRVDQGTINAILKILSFGVNPIYLRKRDSNTPTQMIGTGIGKILTVDTEVDKSYKLLDMPKVPAEVWSALAESEKATESSSGADQTLVQGSTAGPRTSMGRTAGGAAQLGAASATRLDGPLDNFIEQVFKPFLYILDMLIFTYFSDYEIFTILGEEVGKDFEMDFQQYHDAVFTYEVLAGASLAAKRTMSQSMTLIEQIFTNPNIQEMLADINQEYVDIKVILKMWMEASEWKNVQDIIKPMTEQMKQRRQAQSQAAQQNSKFSQQSQLLNQKAQLTAAQKQQDAQDRFQRDIVVKALLNNGESESSEGQPNTTGLDASEPTVE